MNKIIIIGCPGAGKSTFARALRDKLGIELYYLDRIYHRADRTTIPREEFDEKLAEIMKKEQWIIDGNYQRTIPVRLQHCDTVFLLDYPLEVCLSGAESRVGVVREEIPWAENELDPEFQKFISDFSEKQLPIIYKYLDDCENVTKFIFKSREQAAAFLEQL